MIGVGTETMRPLASGSFYASCPHSGNYSYSMNRNDYDVTDNKTTETADVLYINTHRPYGMMSDNLHREDERLKTFAAWPLEFMSKEALARSGMFYTGNEDKVKCYFCEVEIGRWERDDEPVPEHLRWSANCPLLRRRTTNNVPISFEQLDELLPPPSFDVCGVNDAIEVRPCAYPEGSIAVASMLTAPAVNNVVGNATTATATATTAAPADNAASASSTMSSHFNIGAPSTTYYPEFPEYAIESARLRSFAAWPMHMKQKPAELAEAGFFYIGVGDRVKCFSCGGGLKDWDATDEPWEQHAVWLGHCRFLKLIKGQLYIDGVQEKHKAKQADNNVEQTTNDLTEVLAKTEATAEAAVPATAELPANTCNGLMKDNVEKVKTQASIPEEKMCKICYAGEYNTAFLPCGHVVACAKCASSVTKCPLCRKPFTDVMRVYFS